MSLGQVPQPDNSPDQIKIRRSQNTLIIVGTGIIVFGVWSVFKYLGMLIIRRPLMIAQIREAIPEQDAAVSDEMIFGITLLITMILVLVSVVIQLIIGSSAIAEGMDKRHGIIYIPLTILMILFSVYQIIREIGMFTIPADMRDTYTEPSLAAIVIELTSVIMMIQMLASAARIRKYLRRLKKEKKS